MTASAALYKWDAIYGTEARSLSHNYIDTALTKKPWCYVDGELIKDILQAALQATTIKTDLGPLSGPRVFGYARWKKDWVIVRDVVNSIGGAGSTCPG